MAIKYPSIPEPTIEAISLRDAVLSIKQAFEILTGQRGNQAYRAVLLPELEAANATLESVDARLATLEARSSLQVLFSAYGANAATAGTDIIFSTPIFNFGSGYNGSNGRFTAPVAGVYYFRFNQLADNASAGEHRTAIYKNGIGYGGGRFITVKPAGTWWTLYAEGHINMAVGDYVTVRYESGPAALYTDPNYGVFSGHLIK